jgi:hypothetical protein
MLPQEVFQLSVILAPDDAPGLHAGSEVLNFPRPVAKRLGALHFGVFGMKVMFG